MDSHIKRVSKQQTLGKIFFSRNNTKMKMIGVTILLLVAITTISARRGSRRNIIRDNPGKNDNVYVIGEEMPSPRRRRPPFKMADLEQEEEEEGIRNEPESNDNEYTTGQQIPFPFPFPYPPYLRAMQQMADLEQEEEEEETMEEEEEEEEEGMEEEKNAKRKKESV